MSGKLTLELVTPERLALSEAADFVVLPALDGEMGVLPGHEAYLVQLKPGEIRVTVGDEHRSFAVSGGFAEVYRDKVAVFAETAEMAEDIDVERARQALERAKSESHQHRRDPMSLVEAESAMRRAEVRLRVADLKLRPLSKRRRR